MKPKWTKRFLMVRCKDWSHNTKGCLAPTDLVLLVLLMTEKYVSPEYIEDLRTPAERLEEFFAQITKEGSELRTFQFDTPGDASIAADKFTANFQDKIQDLSEVHTTKIRLGGSDVRVPEYDLRSAVNPENDDKGLAILVSGENMLRPLQPFEYEEGYFSGVMTNVIEKEDNQGYGVVSNAIFHLEKTENNPVNVVGTDLSIMDIVIRRKALVELGDDSELVSVELEALRQKYDIASKVSREGLTSTLFIKSLRNLQRAIHSEDTTQYTTLDKVKLFSHLGKLGSAYSRRGQEQSSIVSSAIVDAIGSTRRIQVEFNEMFEDTLAIPMVITGRLNMVIMPDSEEDTTKPAIVLEYDDGHKMIEFDRVLNFRY